MWGVRCGCSVCGGTGLVLAPKPLRGGRGQPRRGLAREGGRLCPGGGNALRPPGSLAAAQPRRASLGEVLVWRVIPTLENY